MDTTIRTLERSDTAEQLIRAKLRAGHFQKWQIDALDKLGHPVFGDGVRKFNWENWDSRKEFLASLPDFLVKQFAISCAEHVLPIWIKEFPDDQRPAQAIQAAKDYLDGKITLEELQEKEDAARAARAAWAAAWSARAAGYAAGYAAMAAADMAAEASWYAGNAAWYAANAAWYAAEYEWQTQELTRMILTHVAH